MKKNNYRGLYIASVILCAFWLVSIIFSLVESIFVGLGIWYAPTVGLALYSSISEYINGASVLDAIYDFFTALIGMPIALFITSFLFAPLAIIALVVYGVFFFIGVGYALVSIICLIIGMIFAIILLVNSAKAMKKDYVNVKAVKVAKVFAILSLVSFLFAWMPNAFSLISIFRYIVILVAAILVLVASSRAIKASKEETEIIEISKGV